MLLKRLLFILFFFVPKTGVVQQLPLLFIGIIVY